MPQALKINPYGMLALQISTVDANGVWTGQAGTAPSANTTSSAYYTNLVSGSSFSPRQQVTLAFQGGDAEVGQVTLGTRLTEPFDMQTEAVEATMLALFSAMSADQTTNSLWTIIGADPGRVTMDNVGIILTQSAQVRDSSGNGTTRYYNVIFPVGTLVFQYGGAAYQSKSVSTLRFTPTFASKFPNGVAFGSNQAFANNQTDWVGIVTDYPLAYTYYEADGIATTFVTGFRPKTTVVTNGATNNWMAKNGTATALSSIVTTTGVATLAAAGSSGDNIGLLYETEFTAI
jgi:hypothetical protein